jgi:maltose alpha-D-glucosyltransferase/alpha-amylase
MPVDAPHWYKDAIIYEVHVRGFQDSDGDGMGDFRGLTQRLDYLQDLGVTAIWLLPFYPSPLRDDGYDIADYVDVHDSYGTLKDFQDFLEEAHRRGLRVITELVLNHTSDQHPWFQRARRAPAGSPERDFYVWAEAPPSAEMPDRYKEARIIFQDFEHSNWTWDPVAKAYFWHRFYSHQPDLNFDNPEVVRAILEVVDFWLGLGVDGLRLDAAPYLFEREGTNCENLPETYEFLRTLRRHVDERFPDRMLLAEANQWPEDAAAYFGEGDACQMAFHFPLMPRMFMAIHMEDRLPIVDILAQTPEIPASCQWAIFLRNHDELTLEMVTDEERDYMNRVYAREAQARINLGIRRRLAPLMRDNRRRIELMNALLFSLPGTPVVYYGDEIGMGDNIYLGDRNGVRTPMQWGPDRNAGFSRGNPQSLYLPVIIDPEFHFEAVNVEAQSGNPHSLLAWMKRVMALRKRHPAFGRGGLRFLHPENDRILAYLREHDGETILVVANLSRFVQPFTLDLSEFHGRRPVELFGRIEFPPIDRRPYALTMGPHSFYWFALEPVAPRAPRRKVGRGTTQLPRVRFAGGWDRLLSAPNREAVEAALVPYLNSRHFGDDPRLVRYVEIVESIPVPGPEPAPQLLQVQAEFFEGQSVVFQIPLALVDRARVEELLRLAPEAAVAEVEGDLDGLLVDAEADPRFARSLLDLIGEGRRVAGLSGQAEAEAGGPLADALGADGPPLDAHRIPGERSNTLLQFGDRFVLKLFRRVAEGPNPDLEINRFLSESGGFAHVPPYAGALHYRRGRGEPMTLAMVQGCVPHDGTAWDLTIESLGSFYRRATGRAEGRAVQVPHGRPIDLAAAEPPPLAAETIGPFLDVAALLGRRTAEMHQALASRVDRPDFAPVAFSGLYQRSMYQSMRGLARRVARRLRHRLDDLPEADRGDAARVVERQDEILEAFRGILRHKASALKTRVHGDYHLGQLLRVGEDFVVIDFEGESSRPIGERRLKRSPLLDVAGLVYSFQYAAYASLGDPVPREAPSLGRPEDLALVEPWARFWTGWVSAAFLRSYLATAQEAAFLPRDPDDLRSLFDAFNLERALDSLGFEVDHRIETARIPIRIILRFLDTAKP